MIAADLHNHTLFSHGTATVAEMYAAAQRTDLEYFGFSEHSPLPPGYACGLYRNGDLSGVFPRYAAEVLTLKAEVGPRAAGADEVLDMNAVMKKDKAVLPGGNRRPTVLFAMELDWIPARREFMEELVAVYPFDYVIGGLHYLGAWSIGSGDWSDGEAACFARYDAYYEEMARMAASGLVNIVAHPDFIKLHTHACFHAWLRLPASLDKVERAVQAMARSGTAMEVSSAGLRRPYREAHPAPAIMALAARAGVRITFGSDSHSADTIAGDFDALAAYARSYGFTESMVFEARRGYGVAF